MTMPTLLENLRRSLWVLRHEPAVLPRRLLLLGLDTALVSLSFWASIALRVVEPADRARHLANQQPLLPWAVLITLAVLLLSGWYRSLVRSWGSRSFYGLLPRAATSVGLLWLVSLGLAIPAPPRTFWTLYGLLLTAGLFGSRILLRDLQRQRGRRCLREARASTLIYGAGDAGLRLIEELRRDRRLRVRAVLDDDPRLWGRWLQGLRIHPPEQLPQLQRRYGVSQVLLAMPSLLRARKRQLLDQLAGEGLQVLEVPSLAQIASGDCRVSDLRALAIEDLLGREPSQSDPLLVARALDQRVVLVSGAGGSIGSELCRQIAASGARRLVLLERNEFALYAIEQELLAAGVAPERLRPVLGDVQHQAWLEVLLRHERVQVLFHAAAYKHVPLLEQNLCAGVANNVLGTRAALHAALACGLERFMLISTDKAVRPANAMGASKRVCELMVQAAAANPNLATRCCMVRFGNVLGSSGSVVPLFRAQIARGGPVTVTHPEITRYFMTIAEAAALVIQASGLASGGEVFVLDMGEPVRIVDLARQMIQLSGLTVRDEVHPHGDVAIRFSGLRPGEKLYEELLLSHTDQPTAHPLIRKAMEESLAADQLTQLLLQLQQALACWDEPQVRRLLHTLVPAYSTSALPEPQRAPLPLSR